MGDVNVAPPSPAPAPAKKSNKIRDIVRLQQMLKKWKKAASATKNNNNNNNEDENNDNKNNVATPNTNNKPTTKGLNKFLKKTLSFSDISGSHGGQDEVVKKGYLAVWVGRDEDAMKKFVIPTDYLTHQAFSVLLRDAEEEFGFQQEGILKIPCDIPLFERILSMLSDNKKHHHQQQQHPTLKSSSSTSSFFLYDQEQQSQHGGSTLKTPPTTPLYCR